MNKGRRWICSLLGGLLIASMVMNAGATNIQQQKDEAQQLENERNEAAAQQKSLEERVNALTASMRKAEADVSAKQTEIEATEEDLVQAKIDENNQYESMKIRIRYMYENGNIDLFQVLLESDSIADFFNKTEYIATISEYDRKKLDEFQMISRAVEEKELILKAEYKELAKLQASIAAQSKEAEELLSEKEAELATLNTKLSDLKQRIRKAEEEERKRKEREEAERKRKEREEAQKNQQKPVTQQKPTVVTGNGYFTHPCPGMAYQSSYFGEVRQGIGDSRPHKGHDYAGATGTPIYAAAAGTVVIAGYSSSAGNWVVINHGNGIVTKYMHMHEWPSVASGEKVAKGQYIGGMGTTGQSTGTHLHFQVELNGIAVNPSKYM